MLMVLVFNLKWVKSVQRFALYIFYLSGYTAVPIFFRKRAKTAQLSILYLGVTSDNKYFAKYFQENNKGPFCAFTQIAQSSFLTHFVTQKKDQLRRTNAQWPAPERRTPEVDHLRPEVGSMKPEVDHLKPEVDHLRPEVDHLRPEVDHLKLEVVSMKLAVDSMKLVDSMKPEVNCLKPEVDLMNLEA